MTTLHPWHGTPVTATERRMLHDLEQQLIEFYQAAIPAGRIIQMTHGTAHLLHSAGITGPALVEGVEAACTAALNIESADTVAGTPCTTYLPVATAYTDVREHINDPDIPVDKLRV